MTELDAFEARFAAGYRRYLEEAPRDVDAMAMAATVAARGRGWRWWSRRVAVPRSPALAWAGLLVLLLAALAAALLLAAARPHVQHEVPLSATGIAVVTTDSGTYVASVVGADGEIWALGGDQHLLVRYNPGTGTARTWTVADDAGFYASSLTAAREGGVWLAAGNVVRRFDGTLFRVVVEAPGEVRAMTEAADGTLWVATADDRVHAWAGDGWTTVDPGRSNDSADISALAIDPLGRLWVGWNQYPEPPGGGWVARYDGSSWETFDGDDATPLGGSVSEIVALADGSTWVLTDRGVAMTEGSGWTQPVAGLEPDAPPTSIVAGADGVLWAAGADTYVGRVVVERFDGRAWTTFEGHGLPAQTPYVLATVALADGLTVTTRAGIYRLVGDRWELAWPAALSAVEYGSVVAVSRDELWVGGATRVWHWLDGTWTTERIDPRFASSISPSLAMAPDGTIWAAWSGGVAYRGRDGWVTVDPTPAAALAFADDGTVWVTGGGVWTLHHDASGWTRRPVDGRPATASGSGRHSLAVDRNGDLWIGAAVGYVPGSLVRLGPRGWETVEQVEGLDVRGAAVLGTTPVGDTWFELAVRRPGARDGESGLQLVPARFDGDRWTLAELPAEPYCCGRLSLGPDGVPWAALAGGGIVRYDGRRWVSPFPVLESWPLYQLAVAPDGAVFAGGFNEIIRLPDLTDRP